MLTRRQAKINAGVTQDVPVFKVTKRKQTDTANKASKKPTKTARVDAPPTPKPESLLPPDAPDLTAETVEINTAASAVAAPSAAIPAADTKFDFPSALAQLCRQDPKLNDVIERSGKPCGIYEGSDRDSAGGLDAFKALATAIVYQQLSGKAASAILRKFLALFRETEAEDGGRHPKWFPTPDEVRSKDVATYRGAGLSTRKAEYLHALADRFIDGGITTEALLNMEDEAISELLCSVKGIGQWTVDMFLMFDLKRANILPVGDLGVRKGMSRHFQMKGTTKGKKSQKNGAGNGIYLPTPEEMREAAKIWEPYRTIASYYMWTITDTKMMEKE